MSHRSLERLVSVLTVVLSFVAGSCGEGSNDDDQVVATSEALTAPDRTFSDASGDVTVLVRTCDWPTAFTTGHRCAYCALDPGWAMIGGGAEIQLQTSTSTNARLRGSLPYPFSLNWNGDGHSIRVNSNDASDTQCSGNVPSKNYIDQVYTAWQARSDGTSGHKLRAYVVGLKIAGVDPLALYGAVLYKDFGTVPLTGGNAFPDRGLLIGGGADVLGSNSGYLTESWPNMNAGGWYAAGYDATGQALIKPYAISIDLSSINVPGWNGAGLNVGLRSVSTGLVSGTGTASGTTRYPFVVSSVGAQGVTNGSLSRFVTGLVPFASSTDGFAVKTQDQGTRVFGPTTGFSLDILGGRWGTWLWNRAIFLYGGVLYRPSGTNPLLQRTSDVPDSAATRWALESFGSGTYRLRNGNPGTGTECAYRESSTSNNVRVKACGTGSEFLWRPLSDPQDIFHLQNVASGKCLDNNNVFDGANSNVMLKSCVAGWALPQEMVLANSNWPIP